MNATTGEAGCDAARETASVAALLAGFGYRPGLARHGRVCSVAPPVRGNYVAKNVVSRHNSPRHNSLATDSYDGAHQRKCNRAIAIQSKSATQLTSRENNYVAKNEFSRQKSPATKSASCQRNLKQRHSKTRIANIAARNAMRTSTPRTLNRQRSHGPAAIIPSRTIHAQCGTINGQRSSRTRRRLPRRSGSDSSFSAAVGRDSKFSLRMPVNKGRG
jgi:hypothetical protein